MTPVSRTDCVVDAVGDLIVVWHVNTGPDRGMSRMAGAWVVNLEDVATNHLLVTQRRVLPTSDGDKALDVLGVPAREQIDPAATIQQLAAQRDELQAVYEAHPNRRNLVAPNWPLLPSPIDPDLLAPKPDAPTHRALNIARWLEKVANCWSQIEGERHVRKYMPGGPSRRPTPISVLPARP